MRRAIGLEANAACCGARLSRGSWRRSHTGCRAIVGVTPDAGQRGGLAEKAQALWQWQIGARSHMRRASKHRCMRGRRAGAGHTNDIVVALVVKHAAC
eukprot:scaffold1531_cov111-Isochrysis_galbana.AAC.4